jgi:hypothetical protein
MADWNKNNLAHTSTFLALRILAQTMRKFPTAGAQEVQNLAFWVVGDSADMRTAKAKSLAAQLHNMFTLAFGSRLESGATKVGSIKAMGEVLADGNKTVNALADVADDNYDFSAGSTP